MKPVYQTILKPPNGNCLQACLASILELELDAVPHIITDDWEERINEFLAMRGLQLMFFPPETANGNAWAPQAYHLITGKSPRGDYPHAIVGFAGNPVHDPYPHGNCELAGQEELGLFIATFVAKEDKVMES